ncbi:hypothetical protein [Burkholderia gladioli]|uniref:hypothetical protein n=1 Tax=Burkholderia gladioli TaxID=28095 RepID=UPI00163ED17D|nr:hypothetical protein [Burkholderia gladioli]
MNVKNITATLVIACCSLSYSHAAPAPKTAKGESVAWTKEPDGFLGIKFGQPFPDESSMPSCPRYGGSPDFETIQSLKVMCFDGYGRDRYGDLWNTPVLGFRYTTHVMIADHKPVSFILDSKPDEFSRVVDVLSNRYGPPTSRSHGSVQNGAGALFDNETLEWVGKKVTITAKMRSDTVDKSQVFISDKAYWDSREAQREKAAKDGASQL